MDIKNTRFSSIEQITGQYLNNRNVRQTDKENVSSFDTILKQKFDDAKTHLGEALYFYGKVSREDCFRYADQMQVILEHIADLKKVMMG